MTKSEIEYGDVEVPDEAFEPKATRVRISIMVPGDVLLKLRERATEEGIPYQTLANQILRKAVMSNEPSLDERVSRLETLLSAREPVLRVSEPSGARNKVMVAPFRAAVTKHKQRVGSRYPVRSAQTKKKRPHKEG